MLVPVSPPVIGRRALLGTLGVLAAAWSFQVADPALAAAPDGGSVPAQVPYAKTLQALIKAWPADLTISFNLGSGGVPPAGEQWQVNAKGLGTYQAHALKEGKRETTTWEARMEVAELKRLLAALTEVDFENARKPVPDSPVQIIGIASGGHTAWIDIYALLPPVASAATQTAVVNSITKLRLQGQRLRPPQVDAKP